jgi:hypothetical protein
VCQDLLQKRLCTRQASITMQLLKVLMLVDLYIQLSLRLYTRGRRNGGSECRGNLLLHGRIFRGVALAAKLQVTVMTVMSVSERDARIGVSIPRASSRLSIFVSQN